MDDIFPLLVLPLFVDDCLNCRVMIRSARFLVGENPLTPFPYKQESPASTQCHRVWRRRPVRNPCVVRTSGSGPFGSSGRVSVSRSAIRKAVVAATARRRRVSGSDVSGVAIGFSGRPGSGLAAVQTPWEKGRRSSVNLLLSSAAENQSAISLPRSPVSSFPWFRFTCDRGSRGRK
ncbi:hypothetical protein HPB50_013121 [Hyalomma asiaticum]|uniref:Uncharacterized protein n=1 Tax=Hyalomma asiaticum TaxID=266040 RepID=A0ACB7S9D4_HYAAI|nr:hypothetical protein HPB50_013121 [Hyalomma asiaticum]